MLLKSLFCLHGRDSRPRFVAISVGVYLGISLAVAAFGANFLMYLLALVGLPLLSLTALRRLTDAAKPKALVVVLILPLIVLLALHIVAAPPVLAMLGLVLGAGATFWGARFSSPTLVDYRFGYYGPAFDTPTSQAIPRRRVEPVITPKAAAAQNAAPNASVDVPVTAPVVADTHAEPTIAPSVTAPELEVLRQDELRFDALTKMTANPADFVVPDTVVEGHADFHPANKGRVEQARIDIADVDRVQVNLPDEDVKRAPLDAEQRDEPVWRFDPNDDAEVFNDTEHAEEVRRRRAEAKESGSMTELFRGVAEFFAPYRRYIKLPKLPKLERRYWLPVGGGAGAVLLVLLVWGLWPSSDESPAEEAVPSVPSAPIAASDRVTLDLPDGFSVALEQDVLIIRWLGEQGKPQNLWSIATAKGDKSCSALVFNNGTEYRTITVDLLADSATEARFTPLDTASIITDLARRGSIGLCGYKFSLKGSQAVLEPNRAFGTYLAR
ncbi:hypothetical protein HRJ35_04330 [Shewanella oneidensis MR-1]|uniref:Predicted inner membrane protein n=1 Tax=Shewanella oneidensis (strain ATCC 700550 / JCM 31522 / CIP 106686 / LMG 19005 / NCIMB 14063 / MR-1) TaxID=211586 RepID=Q8EJU5_SHEON|nr:hypothetical protein [Shewanella oneidensis]AAN53447.2 predicted inner membrane protein [Shewanella oneidensis MR-1]MDX5997686.1 hypothetical protein [Shewanella oneidensis]MEE2029705.1 hypothetical protein [Shewanella oneidensis]QKG95295.1 hypothetical protein HRJ35_04330 [Shewanella oneidensis MR-1]